MPQETNMAEVVRLLHVVIGKVDRLDEKVDRLDGKVDRLDGKVDRLEGRVDRLELKVDGLEVKVDRLEVSVGRLEGKTDSIAETVMTNDRRLISVEHDVTDLKSREH